MRRILFVTCAVVLLGSLKGFAQDPTFSQFYANKIYVNPAFAGSEQGMRLNFNYKNLWTGVPSDFSTFSAGIDVADHNISGGLGFIAINSKEGEGQINTQQYGLMYSYRLIVLPRIFDIHMGIGAHYLRKEIGDWDSFIFSDQINAYNNDIVGSSVVRPEKLFVEMPDFNAGFIARFNIKPKGGRRPISNTIGFAAHHLSQPNESLLGRNEPLPMKFVGHFSMMIPVGKKKSRSPLYLSPNIMYEHQKNLSTLNAGLYAMKAPVMVGVWYRNGGTFTIDNSDAIMVNIGVRFADKAKRFMMQLGYSYDMTISKLAGSTAGTHEVALIIEFTRASLFGSKNPSARKRARNCYKWRGPNSMPKVF
ncbi:MAG: type IX secretion system PorP/SprF family membrane protein [Granulosicoccus sp.]|jgi:type IX secretion system PorP/SprF family membrane protein